MVASLGELLEAQVRERSEAIAIADVTWADLARRARRLAAAMARDGLAAQERVVYIGKNSVPFVEMLFAAALRDLIFVPLSWRLLPAEVAELVKDSGARLVVVDDEQAAALAPPFVKTSELATWSERAPDVAPLAAAADHIAFQLYTSGTTGRAKGAMFANGTNVRRLLGDIRRAWRFGPDDVSLLAMPTFHMGGLAWLLASMAGGSRVVIVRDFDPKGVIEAMARERVTTAFFVPTMLKALLTVPARPLSLRRLFYSGSAIAPSLLRAAMETFACGFVQIYGMTEATGAFAQLEPEDHDPGSPLLASAGRVYPWTELRVVDPVTLAVRAAREPGEIWTRSDQNMVGYFQRPDATSAALTADGWLRTGDIGYVDEQGYIFLLDRHKDMIISGGENVYPVEIESVLVEHPQIAEVAVIGVPSEKWGETVKALVIARAGETIDAASVIAFARSRLATYKCPTSVDVVDVLPRTATGKLRKDVLRDRYWAAHERRIN